MAVDLAKCLVSILAERVKIKGTVYHKIQLVPRNILDLDYYIM